MAVREGGGKVVDLLEGEACFLLSLVTIPCGGSGVKAYYVKSRCSSCWKILLRHEK